MKTKKITIKAFSGEEVNPARLFLSSRPRIYNNPERDKKIVWIPSGKEIRF